MPNDQIMKKYNILLKAMERALISDDNNAYDSAYDGLMRFSEEEAPAGMDVQIRDFLTALENSKIDDRAFALTSLIAELSNYSENVKNAREIAVARSKDLFLPTLASETGKAIAVLEALDDAYHKIEDQLTNDEKVIAQIKGSIDALKELKNKVDEAIE